MDQDSLAIEEARSYSKRFKDLRELRLAAVRVAWMLIFHLFAGFFASLYYSVRTGYWKPFGVATLVALPVIVFNVAILSAAGSSGSGAAIVIVWALNLAPPLVSFFMFSSKSAQMRVRHKVVDPVEADVRIYEVIAGK